MLSQSLLEFLPIDLDEMRPVGFLSREESHIRQVCTNVDLGEGWYAVESCPLCGATERTILFSRCGKDVAQCGNCTLGYMTAFPRDPNDVYSDDDYLASQAECYLENVAYRKARFGKERLGIVERNLAAGVPVSDAMLLDIGCGTGWFLECAKEHGFRVYGVEKGKDLAAFTAERLGVTVWNGDVQDLDAEEQFDAITMFDFIEHVTDPTSVLRAVRRLLKQDGFAIVFTQNLDSFGMRILKERSSLVAPAEHLYHFTPTAFRRMAESAGLVVSTFETRGTDIADIFSFYRDEVGKPEVAEFLEAQAAPLQAMIDTSKCANHMRFTLRPDNAGRPA